MSSARENPYEKLGNVPLGKVERLTLLDVAESSVERAMGYVEKAMEGIPEGNWELRAAGMKMYEAREQLKGVKTVLEDAMKKVDRSVQ